MSLVLSCQSLSKAFGKIDLFEDLSLSVFTGDHIGLIGPNGAGKSTLLKIIAGQETPDEGEVSIKSGTRLAYIPQLCHFPDLSLMQYLLEKGHDIVTIKTWLSKVGFENFEAIGSKLSGGWQKRLAIAEAMIGSPDLLLLDEPTNHLDLEGILWLEKFLAREVKTFVMVSHDRTFLQNLVKKVIEINKVYPTGLLCIEGSYDNFLEKKEQFLEGQIESQRRLATKVRKETEWLRTSPKARTTKAESRIQQAQEILKEYAAIKQRNTSKKADIAFVASERETHKLITAKNLKAEIAGRVLFEHLDLSLHSKVRLALMGPNGSGKTTLLKMLRGDIAPSQGTIKRADNLSIVYFDQHKDRLPLHLTLHEALCPNGDYVFYQGKPVHVRGWCQRFLFSPDYLDLPLSKLSGGERARLTIARLMLESADILLLDEPTNDLDIETLETLEANLMDFEGALVLITHDRYMLEHTCNLFISLGDKKISEFASYQQWQASIIKEEAPKKEVKKVEQRPSKESSRFEKQILQKEKELTELTSKLERTEGEELAKLCKKLAF
jgi:ATP-binding cassette subfamily F protein uup